MYVLFGTERTRRVRCRMGAVPSVPITPAGMQRLDWGAGHCWRLSDTRTHHRYAPIQTPPYSVNRRQ